MNQMMGRTGTLIVTLCIVAGIVPIQAQSWVDSFGSDTRYRPPVYLSGYGTSDLDSSRERLEAARADALSQLSRKIRVQITSEESIRTIDTGESGRTRYVNTIQTASRLEVTGANFEIAEERGRTHALAWIEIDRLRDTFVDQRGRAADTIDTVLREFDRSISDGELERAEAQLVRLDTAFSELVDTESVIRALDLLAAQPNRSGDGGGARTAVLQENIERRRVELERFAPATVEQAAQYIVRMLAGAVGTVDRVAPLLYEDADFSSAFGSRLAGEIAAALSRRDSAFGSGSGANADVGATGATAPVVLRGSYWPEADEVAIHVVARDIQTGRTVAATQTSVPRGAVDPASLQPANMDEALTSGRQLLNDQIVDGGLDLEVWTDKGRDERALVFENGEYVQFYFRVSQPAFLRLSYVLASGETVLLEDRFYIGIDRVNRVVALPYRFEVVPPFGVERLIVTGHTTEPPPVDAYPRVIDGEQYEVFGSPGAAVARTRGLVRERPLEEQSAVGVAEASLSITTIGRTAGE